MLYGLSTQIRDRYKVYQIGNTIYEPPRLPKNWSKDVFNYYMSSSGVDEIREISDRIIELKGRYLPQLVSWAVYNGVNLNEHLKS